MTGTSLADIATMTQGGKLKLSGKHFVESGYPAYGAGGLNGNLPVAEFDRPAIILSAIGARCGKCFLAEGQWTSLANTRLIFPDPDKADIRFLWYQLNDEARWPRSGAAQPFIRPADVNAHKVYLPPLEEQKRIVAVLDNAFAALDRARANVEANRADAEEFLATFVEAELRKSGGEILTLQEMLDSGLIVSHLDGNHGSNYPRKAEFVDAGVPYISANCIVDGQIDLGKAKYLTPKRARTIKKGVAQNGDVIFAHNATVGPVALLKTEENVLLSTSVTYYRPNLDRIIPEFLMFEMRSSHFRKQYEAVMGQATRNQVPITAQRKLRHTIPSLETQVGLVAACSKIEANSRRLNLAYGADLVDLQDLRQSILRKAFAGELT